MSTTLIPGGAVISVCRNLRPDSDGALVPAPAPAEEVMPEGYTPVGRFGKITVAIRGAELSIISRGLPEFTLTLRDVPREVFDNGNRIFVDFHDSSPVLIGIDHGNRELYYFGLKRGHPYCPDFRFRLSSAGLISADVPSVVLSKQWNESRVLSPSDLSNLSKAASTALSELDNTAARRGLIIHPLVIFARVRDCDGRIVYESSPTLLRPSLNNALPHSVTLSETSGKSNPYTLSVQGYSIIMEGERQWAENYPGGTVQVLASPMFPIVDPDGTPVVTGRQRADQQHLCTVKFATGGAAADDDFATLNVSGFIALADSGRFPYTPVYSDNTKLMKYMAYISCYNLTRAHPRDFVKTSPAAPATVAEAYHSIAHTFSGASVAVGGDVVLMADTTVLRAPAPSPSQVFADVADSPGMWDAWVAVDFADGSRLVSRQTDNVGVPVSVKPYLSYPAPDAVSMTIAWYSPAGGHYRVEVPLTCDSSGRRAVYIHPSGLPFVPPRVNEVFSVPDASDAPLRFADCLVAAVPGCLEYPLALGHITAGSVVALLPAPSRQAAWDYGRSRFWAFTTAGVYMVNVDPRRGSMAVSLYDSRVLADPGDAVALPQGVAAVFGSDLLLFSASGISVLATDVGGRQPSWCDDGEIWLTGPRDTLVLRPDAPSVRYTMDFVASRGPGPWLSSAGRWYLPAHSSAALVPVCLQVIVPLVRNGPGELRSLILDARGTFSELRVSAYRSSLGQPAPAPDLRLVLKGRVIGSIRRRFLSPPASQFFLTLEGSISLQSRLSKIDIS